MKVPFDAEVVDPGELPVPVALPLLPIAEQVANAGATDTHSAPFGGSPRLSSQLPGFA